MEGGGGGGDDLHLCQKLQPTGARPQFCSYCSVNKSFLAPRTVKQSYNYIAPYE